MSNRPVDIGPRLIMPGPYEDESISSICDRASALYRINRHTVVHHLTQQVRSYLWPMGLGQPEPDIPEGPRIHARRGSRVTGFTRYRRWPSLVSAHC
jgi:hypothetical protein